MLVIYSWEVYNYISTLELVYSLKPEHYLAICVYSCFLLSFLVLMKKIEVPFSLFFWLSRFLFVFFINCWFHTLVLVETALILIRHGESLWNEKNLFTGCVDVPLTKRGVEEAVEAGKRISNIPVDMIFTSALIRAQMTAMLAMTQHRRKKVSLVVIS